MNKRDRIFMQGPSNEHPAAGGQPLTTSDREGEILPNKLNEDGHGLSHGTPAQWCLDGNADFD
jgi:hypothetical protein